MGECHEKRNWGRGDLLRGIVLTVELWGQVGRGWRVDGGWMVDGWDN